ncbi:MAG: NAD-dependent epimerase/dehydratase family protein [Candidatus Heimdallarchaeota archaeon]
MVSLVTGGTGFLGGFLNELLMNTYGKKDDSIRVICRDNVSKTNIEALGLIPVKADLNDVSSLKNALKDVEVVYNLASLVDDWAGWTELYRVNVEGMNNLINACYQSSTDPFIAHVSSTGVYGHFIPDIPIDENTPFNPTRIYQKSKAYQEKSIWDFSQSQGWNNFSIVRPPSIIGPKDKKTMFQIFKAIYERKLPIFRGRQVYTTWIHPFDLCKALLLIAEKQQKSKGQAYNLKSFECLFIDFINFIVDTIKPSKPPRHLNYRLVYTIATLSEVFAKITGKKTTLNRYRVTKFASSRRFNDQKIRNELGFTPQKDMETTIRESYEWFKNQGYLPM